MATRGSTWVAAHMRLAFPLSLLISPLLVTLQAWSGTLSVEPPKVESNRYVFPIGLDNTSTGVTSMDFQVRYDPTVFTPVDVVAGASATSAGKVVDGNLSAPGTYSVLVMGLNQNGLPPGEVAQVVFERNPDAAASSSLLTIARPTLSDAQGTVMSATGGEHTVNFDQPAPGDEASPKPDALEPKPEESEAPEPATPDSQGNGNEAAPSLGQNVADAMLSSLSRAARNSPEDQAKIAAKAVPDGNSSRVSGEETPQPKFSIRERRLGNMTAEAQAPETAAQPAAAAQDAHDDSTIKTTTPSSGVQPVPSAEAAAPVSDTVERSALTVEKPNDVLVPSGDGDDVQEGGQENLSRWWTALAAAALMGLLLLAVWRRRKPAHS